MAQAPPVVLTIAGFDPSSGAGVTADIKTIAAHGCYGVACITALTVQSTAGVRRVEALSAELVAETLTEQATSDGCCCSGGHRWTSGKSHRFAELQNPPRRGAGNFQIRPSALQLNPRHGVRFCHRHRLPLGAGTRSARGSSIGEGLHHCGYR